RQSPVAHRALLSLPTRRSSDLGPGDLSRGCASARRLAAGLGQARRRLLLPADDSAATGSGVHLLAAAAAAARCSDQGGRGSAEEDRKSTRLNTSHVSTSYAVFC